MDVIAEYTNKLKNTSYTVFFGIFVMLAIVEYFNNPGINTFFWGPPPNTPLLTAQGYFISNANPDCTLVTKCVPGALRFQQENGEIIGLNCEPHPPINTCLQGYPIEKLGSPQHPVQIQYFFNHSLLSNVPYKILMSLSTERGPVLTYQDRLNEIRNTYYYNSRISLRRLPVTQVTMDFFVLKESLIWGLFFYVLYLKVTTPKDRNKIIQAG
jgi:hypothetical protein